MTPSEADRLLRRTDGVMPALWIIESKGGLSVWSTDKPEVATKHLQKPGSHVTPYYLKKDQIA